MAGHRATRWILCCIAVLVASPLRAAAAGETAEKAPPAGAVIEVKPRAVFKGHTDDVYPVAFSFDGKMLASGGQDSQLIVWDLRTGKQERAFKHKAAVGNIYFSPDGTRLEFAGDVRDDQWFYDLKSKAAKPLTDRSAYAAAFDYTGNTFALVQPEENQGSGYHTSIDLFDLKKRSEKRIEFDPYFEAICFSPDGSSMAASGVIKVPGEEKSTQSVVCLINLKSGKITTTIKGTVLGPNDSMRHAVRFTADGKSVIYRRDGKHFAALDVKANKDRPLVDSPDFIYGHAISADGGLIVGSVKDRVVNVWESAKGRLVCKLTGAEHDITKLAIAADDRAVAAGSGKDVIFWALPEVVPATLPRVAKTVMPQAAASDQAK